MRKLLTHLLMLLMLMPGLACGPFMSMGKAQAAPAMQGMENCNGMDHGMKMGTQKQKPDDSSRFFFKDCLKVDLGNAGSVDLQKPDSAGKAFFTAWVAEALVYNFMPADIPSIRGPPPDWPELSRPHFSILTTQRLRI